LTGGLVVAYMAEGRMKLPQNAMVFNVDDNEMEPGAPWPVQQTNSNPNRTLLASPATAAAPAAPAALATALPAAPAALP